MFTFLTAFALFVSSPMMANAAPVEGAVWADAAIALQDFEKQKLKIAVAAELTAAEDPSASPYGIQLRKGVELALSEAQERLKEANIEIKLEDFDSSGLVAPDILNSKAVAVIGHLFSSEALLAADTYLKGPMLFVSPGATADRLQLMGSHIVSTVFNNLEQAKMLVQVANEKGLKGAATIYVDDCAYCEGLSMHFGVEARRSTLGESSVQKIISDDTDLEGKIDLEPLRNASVIFLPNYETVNARIIHYLNSKGIVPDYYFGGDGWGLTSEVFRELVGDLNFKAISLGYWSPGLKEKVATDFSSRFQAKFNILPSDSSVLAYDGMNRLIEIILKSEKPITRAALLKAKDIVKTSKAALGEIRNQDWVISRPYVILEYEGLEVIKTEVKRTEL